ncbi:hypothetical protein ABZ896_12235 [Streptomyces sp. NPDC047072]|uniref:hypothetical protein n=1 Tax=Streptomyces sp. NPDC047072 TaxID=3154809 RepID=UPI0033C42B77
MSLSLASSMQAVARLLDSCGPLAPLRLSLSARDVQAEVCADGHTAMNTLERLAEVTGTDLAGTDYGASLTADLGRDLVLVAGIAPAASTGPGGRATSTQAAADLLRTVAPWAAALDEELQQTAELWVEDDGHTCTLRLLTTAGHDSCLEAVAAAAGKGLARLRTWPSQSGVDGVGQLPCGATVQIGVVSLA